MTLRQVADKYGLTPEGVEFALSQYQIVISEITHGMMSKLSYYAKDVLQVAQERWCDTCYLKDMVHINIPMPQNCADCWVRKNLGCKIANASGWLNDRRDEDCPLRKE